MITCHIAGEELVQLGMDENPSDTSKSPLGFRAAERRRRIASEVDKVLAENPEHNTVHEHAVVVADVTHAVMAVIDTASRQSAKVPVKAHLGREEFGIEERVARHLASVDWFIDDTANDDWERRGPRFRADYLSLAREVIAIVDEREQDSR